MTVVSLISVSTKRQYCCRVSYSQHHYNLRQKLVSIKFSPRYCSHFNFLETEMLESYRFKDVIYCLTFHCSRFLLGVLAFYKFLYHNFRRSKLETFAIILFNVVSFSRPHGSSPSIFLTSLTLSHHLLPQSYNIIHDFGSGLQYSVSERTGNCR